MLKNDHRVLITGASVGLGAELARLYAASGRNLVITARRKDQLLLIKEELESKFRVRVFVVTADLSAPPAPSLLIETIRAQGIHIDVLVNNAGMGLYGEFMDLDFDQIERLYRINILSVLRLTQLVLSEMKKEGKGQVINVASLGAFFPGPLMSVYFAAKADLLSFSSAINYELKGTGVKITTVCPGPFRSEFQQKAFGSDRRRSREKHLPSSKTVARQVFGPICRQQEVVVAGFRNKLIHALCRFVPLSAILVAVFQEQRQLRFGMDKS